MAGIFSPEDGIGRCKIAGVADCSARTVDPVTTNPTVPPAITLAARRLDIFVPPGSLMTIN